MGGNSKEIINQVSKDINETEQILSDFYSKYLINLKGVILLLEGNLGAGKTTTTQILGKLLKIPVIINSPSFNIYNIYETETNVLIHYDLYRITEVELEEMELRELWYDVYNHKFTIHAIEWWQKAEYIESSLPMFLIKLDYAGNQFTYRNIKIFKILDRYYAYH